MPGAEARKDERDWYALRVSPQKEFVVQRILSNCHYLAVAPAKSEWRKLNKYRKGKRRVEYPVMYGYVLIAFPQGAQPPWFNILNFHIVNSVVGFNGRPLKLEYVEDALARWGQSLSAPEIQKYMRTHGEFAVGDEVQVFAGGIDGVHGKVLDINEREAKVLMKFLGSEYEVRAPLDGCVKAA